MQCTIKSFGCLLAFTVLVAQGNKPALHRAVAKKAVKSTARNAEEKAHCGKSSSSSSSDCDPCDTLDAIETVNVTVDEILVIVNELLDQGSEGCSVTVIHATDFVGSAYTISASGNYCLADNVTGRIIVNARSVSLDLGSHIITVAGNSLITSVGVQVNADEVVVKNGVIEGSGQPATPTTNSRGIETSGGSNNRIENLVTRFLGTGIVAGADLTVANVISSNNNNGLVGTDDNLTVHDSSFNLNSMTGLDYSAGNNLYVLNSAFVGNNPAGAGFGGLYIHDDADSIRIEGSNFEVNGSTTALNGYGVFVDSCSCIEFINCFSTGNLAHGFSLFGCEDVVLRDCFACSNAFETLARGFSFTDVTNLAVYNCVADSNDGEGFFSSGASVNHFYLNNTAEFNSFRGFFANSTSGCVYRGNNAFGNDIGFFDNSPASENKFYQNVACNNTTADYQTSGVFNALVSSANTAATFHNVSCSASAIDFCYPADTSVCNG